MEIGQVSQKNFWKSASNDKTVTTFNLINNSSTFIIKRDNSLCCISGTVRDENHFLNGVKLRIGNVSTLTNSYGWFSISIPPDLQNEEYKLIAEKDGYKIWEETVFPTSKQEIGILLKRQ